MVIIWGYTPENTLESNKEIGGKITSVKQLFSALLFKAGIKGISVNIVSFEENTSATIVLYIDSEKVYEVEFSPQEAKDYYFELEEIVKPELKIEVVLCVSKGSLQLPLSSIGTGMGFQKNEEEYLPTNHLALGLIVP